MKAPMWRVCDAGVFPPIYRGLYRSFFISCRRGPGGNTAPQYLEKLMQYSPSEAIGILCKTGRGFALKGVVFEVIQEFVLVTFEEMLRKEFHQSCNRKSKGLHRKPF